MAKYEYKDSQGTPVTPLWARLSSRLVAKVLRKKKQQRELAAVVHAKKIVAHLGEGVNNFTQRIAVLQQKYPFLRRYHPQIALLLLLFAIFHPGLHSRTSAPASAKNSPVQYTSIPPRKHLSPRETGRLAIDSTRGTLQFLSAEREIFRYPISMHHPLNGEFRVTQLVNDTTNGMCVYLTASSGSQENIISLCGSNGEFPRRINLDDDLLEAIYPYLRVGTQVTIR